MKALTLWQPWASLCAIGAKRFETRSWTTSHRGQLAIHSAKTTAHDHIAEYGLFRRILRAGGVDPDNMPHGSVLAVFDEIQAVSISSEFIRERIQSDPELEHEMSFGDWQHGRFAWELNGRHELAQPIPARGRQGLWTWQPPKELLTLFG